MSPDDDATLFDEPAIFDNGLTHVRHRGAREEQPSRPMSVYDAGDIDPTKIPPRGWLLGNLLCRGFLSAIFADGSVGKTALIIAMALSLATGQPLIGEHVFVRSRVLIVCFEDGADELRRRLTAAILHYGISKNQVREHLFGYCDQPQRRQAGERQRGRDHRR